MACCKKFKIALVVILNSADLIADWLQWNDVKTTEEGEVLGSSRDATAMALLVFSIIGSVTYVVEFSLNLKQWCSKKEGSSLGSDIVSIVSTIIEDLPQIVITIYIARQYVCTADQTFQIIKGSASILEALAQLIIGSVELCQKRSKTKDTNKGCQLKCGVFFGFFLLLCGAVGVLAIIFTC